MRKKDETELRTAQALKVARSAIRLAFSLKADEAINEKLPALEAEIRAAVDAGEEYRLDIGSILEDA